MRRDIPQRRRAALVRKADIAKLDLAGKAFYLYRALGIGNLIGCIDDFFEPLRTATRSVVVKVAS
jgi:hypothetical protein